MTHKRLNCSAHHCCSGLHLSPVQARGVFTKDEIVVQLGKTKLLVGDIPYKVSKTCPLHKFLAKRDTIMLGSE